jgi:hypothetical protein
MEPFMSPTSASMQPPFLQTTSNPSIKTAPQSTQMAQSTDKLGVKGDRLKWHKFLMEQLQLQIQRI